MNENGVLMKPFLHKMLRLCCCAAVIISLAPAAMADGNSSSSAVSSSSAADSSSSAVSSVGIAPQIAAQTAVVVNAQSMQIYYQKDMHRQMYPASITKLMTGLLAAENGNADDVVTVSDDVGKSQGHSVAGIGLEPGEQMTQDSLMYTMFLASANDSAYVLAEHIGGTVDNFVTMMNYRAQQLGTTDTHFSNPNGLPDKNNYTSVYDMSLITRQAVNTPEEMTYFGAVKHTVPANNVMKNSTEFGTIVSMMRPDSMYYYPGIVAAKSGWIVMSGFTLVTVAKRGDRTLICVQMDSDSWSSVYNDAKALLDYSFAQPDPVKSNASVSALGGNLTGTMQTLSSPKADSVLANVRKNDNSFITSIIIAVVSVSFLALCIWVCLKQINKRKIKPEDVNIE
jgi:D-alanyl-D-alanine carboxypeptidase